MFFSIITPTYNRAKDLHNVFESLRGQSFTDFEWVIVDDGSTDNTQAVVTHMIQKSPFKIIYVKIPHGGKHFATRRAYSIASGEWAFEIDSDDMLYDNKTLTLLSKWIADLSNDYCAVAGCFIDQNDSVFPVLNTPYIDYDRKSYIDTFCNPKTWSLLNIPWIMKTSYARSVLPPKITDNLSYFPEAVINLRRVLKNRQFKLRVYNVPVYRYNTYNADSVSVHTKGTNAMWWYHKSMILDLNRWGGREKLAKKYPDFYRAQVRGLFNFRSKTLREKYSVLREAGDLQHFWRQMPRYLLKQVFSIDHRDNTHHIKVFGINIK